MKRNIKAGVATNTLVRNLNVHYLNDCPGAFYLGRYPAYDYKNLTLETLDKTNEQYALVNFNEQGWHFVRTYFWEYGGEYDARVQIAYPAYHDAHIKWRKYHGEHWDSHEFFSLANLSDLDAYIKKSDLQKILNESNTFEEFKTKFDSYISQISTLKSDLGGGQLSENQ